MPVYYDESPAFDHGKLRACKTAGRTPAIFRKMQSWSGSPARIPSQASRNKNDPFSSARGDRLTAPATKSAHLLRLTQYPRPYPLFMKNRRRSTCGFYFALLAMVEGSGLNVVDGPISWQTGHFRAGRVAWRPAHAFTRGAGGAILPHRPLFQLNSSAIPAWFLPWGSCPPRPECARCP